MSRWDFWIDVGGTFTDCIARSPSGQQYHFKTLSSGAIKGSIGLESDALSIRDERRSRDPEGFWRGWTCRLIDDAGQLIETRQVVSSHGDGGALVLDRALSEVPPLGASYELYAGLEAPLVAIRYLLQLPLDSALPSVTVRLGTTRGTNALLTRRGARVVWVTTHGFADLLDIGYQARPELFALAIKKPPPLASAVLEVNERIGADGQVLQPLDIDRVRHDLARIRADGIESVAVGLINSYLNSEHEQQIGRMARAMGFADVSLSSEVAPLIKLVARGDTTVVNGYLNPILREYLSAIDRAFPETSRATDLRIMTSAGGLVSADRFQGKDSVLSGPAGGVVGCAGVAKAAGFSHAIGFDMGGTSTDVTRYDDQFDYEFETEKAGVRIVAPMLAIETVAAGGGSVCRFNGVKLSVGPESAGAEPGPACYGRGGPLTVTDMNLYLGLLPADALPFPLDREAVHRGLQKMRQEIVSQGGPDMSPHELADGFRRIANANMAQAIRTISIAQGYDPRDYVLVSFGGAAPQHACAVARELGIQKILDHSRGSLLSALGMGLADVTRHTQQGVYRSWEECRRDLPAWFNKLRQEAIQACLDEGLDAAHIRTTESMQLRYQGTDWPLSIQSPPHGDYDAAFRHEHQRLYGYQHVGRPLEVVALHVEAVGHCGWELPKSHPVGGKPRRSQKTRPVWLSGQAIDVPVYHRAQLDAGDSLAGPAIVIHDTSTTIIEAGWEGQLLSQGELLLTDLSEFDAAPHVSTTCDPVTLEIFRGHFEGIARQMGVTLRNTSSSVNVKERLDFSCAIFTAEGHLVVNAPHIPVHLGAMGQTVQCVLEDHRDLAPGDVVITNDPFRGGSHLPDVTVVTPVFDTAGTELRFLVANRAHHAEIGGTTPGSMPPFSRRLIEEGVLIRSFKVIRGGKPQFAELTRQLREAKYPTRDVDTNLADIRAQIAANRQGVQDLERLENRYGWGTVAAYMQHIQSAAETKTRLALREIPNGVYRADDHLDDGSRIAVEITVQDDHATIDFSGTSDVLESNLNANLAIVSAAVMYTLRCLIDEPIPLNHGVMQPIQLIVPECMLNPPAKSDPAHCVAVVGGNVETSQRVVDVLFKAFQLAAASQGTMNNLLFGNDRFGYYETICGGSGATANADGADAVHTHMTNTRLTDPEVLEAKYPLRVRQFAIRRGSGGLGQHRGGDGVIREFEFLAPLEVSILSQRRGPYPPYGLSGGQPGAVGQNLLTRARQTQPEHQPAAAHFHVDAGDRLRIETPGGGGFGIPSREMQ